MCLILAASPRPAASVPAQPQTAVMRKQVTGVVSAAESPLYLSRQHASGSRSAVCVCVWSHNNICTYFLVFLILVRQVKHIRLRLSPLIPV